MAIATKKMPLARAQQLAVAVRNELAPACERIEVAGSIRRLSPQVSDIEIVAVPKGEVDLLGTVIGSRLNNLLLNLEDAGRIQRIKGGEKYKQYLLPHADCKLDLFIVDRETWGIQFLIRTGPSSFSKSFVTQRKDGGKILPLGWRVENGRLWNDKGLSVSTPEEIDVFRRVGLEWIEPWKRV